MRMASGDCEIDIPRRKDMSLSKSIILHLSNILVDAVSYLSKSWMMFADWKKVNRKFCMKYSYFNFDENNSLSSSALEPHPRTLARSLPVPSGSTAI